tara:strand:- start:17231 stop:17875 length:645 start_codon:yes stop_codon:yes gene_type:complete
LSEEFIREVDEDLRQKQLTGLWQKYGSYLIAFLVGIVIFVAGNVTLKNYNESQYAEVAEQYGKVQADVTANQLDQALKDIEAISGTDVEGYKLLIGFKTADIHMQKGETEKAVVALDELSSAAGVEKVYRDLARLKAAMIAMDTATYDETKARLAPLTIEGNSWKYMAKELLAMAALTAGHGEEAKNLLTELEQDLEAPDDVKTRAKDFKSVIQ